MSPRFCSLLALAVACSTTGIGANVSVASEPSFLFMVDQPHSSESASGKTTAEARAAKAEKARRLGCESSSSGTNDAVYAAEAGNPAETGSAHSVDNPKRADRSRAATTTQVAADCKDPESAEPEAH
jgi:hypothetical protein